MELRLRLGQTLDYTNLVTDGTFDTACAGGNWTCAAGWNIPVGAGADHAGAMSFLEQNNVFIFENAAPDTIKYRIMYDVTAIGANAWVKHFVGNDSIDNFVVNAFGFNYTYDFKHLDTANEHLRFLAENTISIDNVRVYNWKWNDPLENQPSFKDTKLKIVSEMLLEKMICTWDGEITLDGDGYTFLKDIFDDLPSDEACEQIDILIERFNRNTLEWENHYEGYVYITDCEFDFKKRNVIIKKIYGLIEDAVEKLFKKEGIVEPIGRNIYATGTTVTESLRNVNYRDNGGPSLNWNTIGSAYRVRLALEVLAHTLSDLYVTIDADMFEIPSRQEYSVATDDCVNTTVAGVSNTDAFRLITSLEDFIKNLSAVFAIGVIESTNYAVPTLNIGRKEDFGSTTHSTFSFENVNAEITKFNDTNVYSKLTAGYAESQEFSIYDNYEYVAEDKCSTKSLGVNCEYMGDDTSIDNLLWAAATTSSYITIACFDNAGTIEARHDILDVNYNELHYYTPLIATNHVWYLQSSFIGVGLLAGSAIKTNDTTVKQVEFREKITLDILDVIRITPNARIPFTAPEYNLPATQEGYIIEFEYDNISEVAKFILLI